MRSRVNRRNFLRFTALAATAPIFDLKLPRGLDFTLQNSPTPQKYLIETMPGGVALLDYNNDGLLDIFLVNGGRLTSPMQVPRNSIVPTPATGTVSIARTKTAVSQT